MKRILLAIIVLAVLMLAACTKITESVDVSGDWTVYATISGKAYQFEITVVQDGLWFDASSDNPDIIVVKGALTTTKRIRLELDVKGKSYYMYGTATELYADGFIRQGEAGDIVGNWSMER